MRHKWVERIFSENYYSDYGDTDGESARPVKIISNTKECSLCGLRQGTCREFGFFPTLVYFDDVKVLSRERIPFSCHGEWIGGELPINKSKVVFICEEEFKV